MKLLINIPCFNEENTLPQVLAELPKKIAGIDHLEVQIVDDGSTDKTLEIAQKAGCRIIKHKTNLGLGVAFKHGLESALENGADIMVNTDADNQYPSKYIAELITPILEKKADVVIGDRQTWKIAHFNAFKKVFQWFGSSLVRLLTGTDIIDTVSGFRAYSREALLKLNVSTRFSYVLDTIMQCAQKDIKMLSIPIETNKPTRKSRLFRNMFQHMWKSGFNLLRVYIIYKPFNTFMFMSAIFFIPALLIILRFFYFFSIGDGRGHIQSLIGAAILAITAVMLFVLGIVGTLLRTNRELLENILYLKKREIYRKEK